MLKHLPRPHQAPNKAASSPISISQLTFLNFKILNFSKKYTHQIAKHSTENRTPPLQVCEYIPVQHRAEGAAVGAWVLLEPSKEEQTDGAVERGG